MKMMECQKDREKMMRRSQKKEFTSLTEINMNQMDVKKKIRQIFNKFRGKLSKMYRNRKQKAQVVRSYKSHYKKVRIQAPINLYTK